MLRALVVKYNQSNAGQNAPYRLHSATEVISDLELVKLNERNSPEFMKLYILRYMIDKDLDFFKQELSSADFTDEGPITKQFQITNNVHFKAIIYFTVVAVNSFPNYVFSDVIHDNKVFRWFDSMIGVIDRNDDEKKKWRNILDSDSMNIYDSNDVANFIDLICKVFLISHKVPISNFNNVSKEKVDWMLDVMGGTEVLQYLISSKNNRVSAILLRFWALLPILSTYYGDSDVFNGYKTMVETFTAGLFAVNENIQLAPENQVYEASKEILKDFYKSLELFDRELSRLKTKAESERREAIGVGKGGGDQPISSTRKRTTVQKVDVAKPVAVSKLVEQLDSVGNSHTTMAASSTNFNSSVMGLGDVEVSSREIESAKGLPFSEPYLSESTELNPIGRSETVDLHLSSNDKSFNIVEYGEIPENTDDVHFEESVKPSPWLVDEDDDNLYIGESVEDQVKRGSSYADQPTVEVERELIKRSAEEPTTLAADTIEGEWNLNKENVVKSRKAESFRRIVTRSITASQNLDKDIDNIKESGVMEDDQRYNVKR